MSKVGIKQEATFQGEWFLPTDDIGGARKIPGALEWTTRRATLSLHDCFTSMRGDVHGDEINRYPAIHGISLDSQWVSMLDATSYANSLSFGGSGIRQKERLGSSLVIVGGLVTGSTVYDSMRVRIPGLEHWLNRGGITMNFGSAEGGPADVVYTVEHMPAEVFRIAEIDANIIFGIGRSMPGIATNNITVNTYGSLTIHPDAPQTLDWYFEQLGKISTLLSFLCGTPMGADQIQVRVGGTTDLEVLVALRQDKLCSIDDARFFFLLRSGLGVDFGSVLSKWFANYEKLAIPSQLAQSVLSTDDLWMHVEFLSLMQALEGFHRAVSPGLYIDAAAYEPIRQKIIAGFPPELESSHRSSLKSRIQYGNEISLAKRMNELAKRLPDEVLRRLLGLDGKVPRSWIDTRNYYTHWDEDSRENVLDGVAMHQAGVRLRLFLRVLYLDFVGIPTAALMGALSGINKEAQYLIQLNNSELRRFDPTAKVKPLMSINLKDAAAPDDSQN